MLGEIDPRTKDGPVSSMYDERLEVRCWGRELSLHARINTLDNNERKCVHVRG